ncbi:MAG: acetolactate synthase small subunit [Candidatus Micrarchaeota archaeon]
MVAVNGNGKPGKTHVISILVEDHFGALQRVAGVFSRRGFNMNTITVGKTEKQGLSRMTITTTGDKGMVEQIVKQLNKLVDAIKVSVLDPGDSVVREIALVKVHVKNFETRNEVMNYSQIFRARVVDVSSDSMMVEVTGTPDKIDAFVELIRPFGLKEFVRTGITALNRD